MPNAYEYIQAAREGARRRLTEEFVRCGLIPGGRVFYAPYASREAVPIDDVRTDDDGELVYHTSRRDLTDGLEWFRVWDHESIRVMAPEEDDE